MSYNRCEVALARRICHDILKLAEKHTDENTATDILTFLDSAKAMRQVLEKFYVSTGNRVDSLSPQELKVVSSEIRGLWETGKYTVEDLSSFYGLNESCVEMCLP